MLRNNIDLLPKLQLLPFALKDALGGPWCIDRGLHICLHQLGLSFSLLGLGILGVGEEEVQIAVNRQYLAGWMRFAKVANRSKGRILPSK